VDLHLNLAGPDDQMTGNVNNNAANGWNSELLADRAVFSTRANPATNYAGKYNLIIPPGSNEPGGYGYATLTNNLAGHVLLNGHLGDGAAFSQSVPISKDGIIPFYVSLYSHQGLALGWLTLTNNPTNISAQTVLGDNLSWIKLSGRPGTLYAGGFTNTNITVLGSLYVPPQPGANILTLTNGTLTISNGNLTSALIYSNLTVQGSKLLNNESQTIGVIAPGTGALTVKFQAPGDTTNTVAKGVVLQNNSQTNAAGWFLGTSQSGYFLLQ
jgi:hypothetical protein